MLKRFLLFLKSNKYLLLVFLGYFIIFSFLSCLKHVTFQTQTYDLGIFEQIFWNSIHGNFLYNSIENLNHLAVHMSPFIIFLIPFYYFFQSPYFLLIIQTFFLALGAIPIYLLSSKQFNKKISLLFSIMFLIYPSLHYINLYDFHIVAFAIPLLLFSLYFIESGKKVYASIFLLLSVFCKENIAIATAFIGLYILFFKKQRLFGALILFFSLLFFFISSFLIMPALGGGLLRLDRYSNLGEGFFQIFLNTINPIILFKTIFNPTKLLYLFKLFFPIGFLPLLSVPGFLLLIPGLAQNLLTNYSPQFSSHYQYDSILIPFIFFSMILVFKRIFLKNRERARIILLICFFFSILFFFIYSPISPFNFDDNFYSDQDVVILQNISHMFDVNLSIASTTFLAPHLANRKEIYLVGHEPFGVDVIIVDILHPFPFQTIEEKRNYLSNYSNYSSELFGNRYLILRKS